MKDAQQEKTIRIAGVDTPVYADAPVRVACAEHIERELDDYVDKHEAAPDTYPIEQVDDPALDKCCSVCGAEGKIVLLRVKGR